MSFKMDTTKSKIVFKKRAHRPWQSHLLDEGQEDNINVLEVSNKHPEKQFDLLQKQLEGTLDLKNREREEINHTLKTLDDHRITFGGFLKPKDILLVTEHESLKKTSFLINELKEKEKEIVEITQHLRITQAEEKAERAESAKIVEEKARHAAEEKAIFALRQAHLTAEQIKDAEARVLLMEQTKLKLEHHVFDLEEKLKLTSYELETLGQKTKISEENESYFNQEIHTLTKQLNDEKQAKKIQEDTLLQQLEDIKKHSMQQIEDIKTESLTQVQQLQDKLQEQLFLIEEANHLRLELEEQFARAHSTINEMTITLDHYELNSIQMKEEINIIQFERDEMRNQMQMMQIKLAQAQLKQSKMIELAGLERNLRIMFEDKLKDAITEIGKTELRRRAESEARRIAEEKTKHTIEQAGKAMIQLLHNPMQDKATID